MTVSVNGNHSASVLDRNNGVVTDVGVAAPGNGIIGTSGLTMVLNVAAGVSVNDCAGVPGSADSSINGNRAVCYL